MSDAQADPAEETPNPAAEAFYSGAVGRITRTVLVLGISLAPVVWLLYGPKPAAGFLLGGAVSYLNFHWLARAVRGLAGRIVEQQSRERGGTIVARFLFRYVLIGLAAYVTFMGWSGAFHGLLGGLCLPVGAMMAEAGYELYVAMRRGL